MAESRRDMLIEYIKGELYHGFALGLPETYIQTMKKLEKLIDEHRTLQGNLEEVSTLQKLVPSVGLFHTPLRLAEAWSRYDLKYSVSGRCHVAPSFNEVRHTLNLAQVMESASELEMICFDGDQTLYSDGGNFSYKPLANTICMLLENNVNVVIITAAGYGYESAKYETRLRGLLDSFIENELSPEVVGRFYVLGGECNYLLRCGPDAKLVKVPDEDWSLTGPAPRSWDDKECQYLLDVAEQSLRKSMSDLKLRAKILRKPRGIGLLPGGPESVSSVPSGHGSLKLKKEALDEVVLRAQHALKVSQPSIQLPFCAFNGGSDAWIDVGNKCIGVEAMQAYLGVRKERSIHVGDQFLKTGNDVAARTCSPCIWIISPKETLKVLEILLGLMGLDELSGKRSSVVVATPKSPKLKSASNYSFPELAIPSAGPGFDIRRAASDPLPTPPP